MLTQVLGLSYAETAEICGCEIGTVRSRVSPARGVLVDRPRRRATSDGRRVRRCRPRSAAPVRCGADRRSARATRRAAAPLVARPLPPVAPGSPSRSVKRPPGLGQDDRHRGDVPVGGDAGRTWRRCGRSRPARTRSRRPRSAAGPRPARAAAIISSVQWVKPEVERYEPAMRSRVLTWAGAPLQKQPRPRPA